MAQPWKSGLFDCFQDFKLCALGCVCPCYLFGENAHQIDGSGKIGKCVPYALLCGVCGLHCLLHKPIRQKFRAAHNLEEKPNDFLATWICSFCGNCQEARELKAHGGGHTLGAAVPRPVATQPGRK